MDVHPLSPLSVRETYNNVIDAMNSSLHIVVIGCGYSELRPFSMFRTLCQLWAWGFVVRKNAHEWATPAVWVSGPPAVK
jgi:hypothetical protein